MCYIINYILICNHIYYVINYIYMYILYIIARQCHKCYKCQHKGNSNQLLPGAY